MYKWIDFPYKKDNLGIPVSGRYLYALGGFHSIDNGCVSWGSSNPKDVRFIGDLMGYLNICYKDGSEDKIPLIFGYSLWFHSIWAEHPAPFFPQEQPSEPAQLLKKILCVQGAYEGNEIGILKIAIKEKEICSIFIEGNDNKSGVPVYYGAYLSEGNDTEIFKGGKMEVDPRDSFYSEHTIDADDPYPASYLAAMEKICYALHTFDSDFDKAPEKFTFPEEPKGYCIQFQGNNLAQIATGVIYHNMINLVERSDDDGFIHTSYKDAPSWRYDGFGPYVLKANSYTHLFYSRDAGRAIMTLNSFGHTHKANAGCNFGNRWMMYYREQDLKIKGVPIPGHFSVMPNDPLVYSKILAPVANWPTRYTEELFGEGYQNLGNQETDGHGLMMMANYKVWINLGKDPSWVEKNWTYIQEAVQWIIWCYEHTDLSFVRNDLLYGETEASLDQDLNEMGWTMYSNLPCYLGILGYAQMAESIGKYDLADTWMGYGERIRRGIDSDLILDEGWDLSRCGFCHDPVPTMLSDFYGYDTWDMPKSWIDRSIASYRSDIEETVKFGWFGRGKGTWQGKGSGIGYDHSMITQNALLLDQMYDASKLVQNLSKISYAPRLPEPYIIPEGVSVDASKGVIRRQGDLGNLVQLAEAMKCYLLVIGIAPVLSGRLKIMPRLPKDWSVDISDFPLENGNCLINMKACYPKDGTQSITVTKNDDTRQINASVRFGPFPKELKAAKIILNNKEYDIKLSPSGDSAWGWVDIKI